MRWPGHSAFWKKMVDLKFLDEEPVLGLPCEITHHQFMVKHLNPSFSTRMGSGSGGHEKYCHREEGWEGQRSRLICWTRVIWNRLFAMNRTVDIRQHCGPDDRHRRDREEGFLTPVRDVPYRRFLRNLQTRDRCQEQSETISE
jgi:hypothetical protein